MKTSPIPLLRRKIVFGLVALLLVGVLLALVWTGTDAADAQGDDLHYVTTATIRTKLGHLFPVTNEANWH